MCTSLSVGTFYIFLTGAPFVARGGVSGMSTTWIGVGLGSITGRFHDRLDRSPRGWLHAAGSVAADPRPAAALRCWGSVRGASRIPGRPPRILWCCLRPRSASGLGNGLTIANTNAGMISVRPDLAGSAAGLSGALQLFGSARR
jgi:DHA1 family bicyclomycin/chloramphenicol resistance-like MFS transporter